MKTAKKHVKKARTPQASKTLEVLKIRARDLAQAVGLIALRISQLPVVPSAPRRRSDEETDKLAREFAPLLAEVSDITIEFLKQALRADALARQLDRFESLDRGRPRLVHARDSQGGTRLAFTSRLVALVLRLDDDGHAHFLGRPRQKHQLRLRRDA